MDVKKLIEEVIYDLANNDSLSSTVTKLQVISKLLKNKDFQAWIESEFIYGYPNDSDVADYRKIKVSNVKASFLLHQPYGRITQYTNFDVPISNLGLEKYEEFCNLSVRENVFAIEEILLENKGNLHLSLNAYEKLLIQQNILTDCEISNINKIVPRQYFKNIVSTSKAKLLDTFLELNETVFNNEINFNMMEKKEEIAQIVNHTINAGVYLGENSNANINDSNVIVGSNNQIHFSEVFKKSVLELAEKVEELSKEIDVDREDIAFEITNIKLELENGKSPKVIKSAFNAIKGIASSIAANEITEVINHGFQSINF